MSNGTIIGTTLIPRESNNAVPVNVQDQTSRMLDLRFIQAVGAPTTLKVAAVTDAYTIEVTDTTGFVDGVEIGIFDAVTGDFYFGNQVGAPSGDTLTLDTPIDYAYPIGSNVVKATCDMVVDGSSTRQVFQVGPVGGGTGVRVDVTKITGVITDNLAMDDSKFGGIAALTNGCVLRRSGSRFTNYGNVKKNKDIGLYAGKAIDYTDKAGGGEYSMSFEFLFSGQENHGVTIRLEPGDILEVLIQDDLTDLSSFEMLAQGHIVTD